MWILSNESTYFTLPVRKMGGEDAEISFCIQGRCTPAFKQILLKLVQVSRVYVRRKII
jgi:hypothetical protein